MYKCIHNSQHSIRHLEFLPPWNKTINYCWRSLRVRYSSFVISHPWIICHCFSGKLGLVSVLILSIVCQHAFTLPFTYFNNYKPENNVTQDLLQIGNIYIYFLSGILSLASEKNHRIYKIQMSKTFSLKRDKDCQNGL